jgi:uncharacterized membrane protein
MKRTRYISRLVIALAAFGARTAAAELRVCNRSTTSVSIAVAFYSSTTPVVRGWYNAAAGECITAISGNLDNRFYYIRAEGADGGTWGDDYSFCTSKTAFNIAGVSSCGSAGYAQSKFYRVDTGDLSSYTSDLVPAIDPQEMHSAIAALRVAWRLSTLDQSSYVLQLSNGGRFDVAARVRCYTRGGSSKTFPLTIHAGDFEEIGFVQGWEGNFVPGERCELYHGSELVRDIGGPR